MKRVLRQAAKAVFAGLDVVARPLTGPRILIYHQVGGGSGLEMEVEPEVFRWQLDWLADHWSVVDLDAAIEAADADSVVLTFDDGYSSLYDVAFPLLKERGLPFTLYLTTEPVETGEPMREHAGAEPLTWGMIRKMRDSGLLTVGAHTHTHPDLRNLDPVLLEEELDRSDELILSQIGVQPIHFAYPWGYWSEQADRLVRKNYTTAALGSRLPRSAAADTHLIYRLPVQLSDGRRWFPARTERGLLFEESIRRRLRRYMGK